MKDGYRHRSRMFLRVEGKLTYATLAFMVWAQWTRRANIKMGHGVKYRLALPIFTGGKNH